MKTKITAVTIPAFICGIRIRVTAARGGAPRSIAALNWFQSNRSSDA